MKRKPTERIRPCQEHFPSSTDLLIVTLDTWHGYVTTASMLSVQGLHVAAVRRKGLNFKG